MMPDESGHPDVDEMEIGAIFAALADPARRKVVLALAADRDCIRHCSAFDLPVTKATRTHHFRVLRESGLIRQVDLGNSRTNQLRWSDLEERFPDLLRLLAAEAAAETTRRSAGRVMRSRTAARRPIRVPPADA